MFRNALFAILLTGASLVNAHGYIQTVKINGKSYPGASGPGSKPSQSPVRAVSTSDPVTDVTSSSIACGLDAKKAPVSAQVKPGDKVEVTWQGGTGIPWFHDVGE